MHKVGWMAGVLVLAGLQFGCAWRGTEGGGSGEGGVGVLRRQCPNDQNCSVAVTVGPMGAPACNVKVREEIIVVEPGKKPKVVWTLPPAPSTTQEYRFDPRNGIVIVGNDPDEDFKCDDSNSGAEFACKSVHKRKTPPEGLKYWVYVQARKKNSSDRWAPCNALDPRIINE